MIGGATCGTPGGCPGGWVDQEDVHVEGRVDVVGHVDVPVDLVEPLGRLFQARIEEVNR